MIDINTIKPGDKVRIVQHLSADDYNMTREMVRFAGQIVTVREKYASDCFEESSGIRIEEDIGEHTGNGWFWNVEYIEPYYEPVSLTDYLMKGE